VPADITNGDWTPAEWHALLRRHDIRPDKRLGQNFLFGPGSLRKVVAAADLVRWPTVLEIGAGVGSLTRVLAQACDRLVAVEFDRRLFGALRETVEGRAHVELVQADILKLDLGALFGASAYAVVANIPYNITSAVIRKLLEANHPPGQIVLTVQREVAERIVAEPGEMSLLALSVQLYGSPSVVATLPAQAFYPVPKVGSAVLRIGLDGGEELDPALVDAVFALAHAGFGQRRKQLRNSLEHGTTLDRTAVTELLASVAIDPKRRPQSLSVAEWKTLANAYLGMREAWRGRGAAG
jgi:16S rRNA (adenine1518-N6/adenine1519-N6)-dimethyltransferase